MKNTVTPQDIRIILDASDITVETKFGKTTIVTCKLPNGFVLIEDSSCVDPSNYDEAIGKESCMQRIENRLWELEGYALANKLLDEKIKKWKQELNI